jgi:ribosomal-protein-alanine N-acetyltransferase
MSNTPAVNLYKKMGFKILRTIGGYYADGEDAYIMSRKLPYEPISL